jgi:hypothetical protein
MLWTCPLVVCSAVLLSIGVFLSENFEPKGDIMIARQEPAHKKAQPAEKPGNLFGVCLVQILPRAFHKKSFFGNTGFIWKSPNKGGC